MDDTILVVEDFGRVAFPQTPFESIGFAISGGGYRAAAYGLGVMSMLNEIKISENDSETPLLQKVQFLSSTSGGTITATLYAATLKKGLSFIEFFQLLDEKLTGEALVQTAIGFLKNDNYWTVGGKSRNIINAFAVTYHESLFDKLGPNEKNLGYLMGSPATHIQEFCFNATEFYTGISFRFQGATGKWIKNKGGQFGNGNISNDFNNIKSADTLKKIRLADALAASSCFPMGFEPIIFPRDFAYSNGASKKDLEDAICLDMYSWDLGKTGHENEKSERARREKDFADKKEFGLMDGGICDNQGLYSMMEANKRSRFDLMMVSDVASFFMSPYVPVKIGPVRSWMQNRLSDYWNRIKGFYKMGIKITRIAIIGAIFILIVLSLPIIFEGRSIASSMLVIIGIGVLATILKLNGFLKRNVRKYSEILQIVENGSLTDLYRNLLPRDNFANRTVTKVIDYLQDVPISVISQMILSRAQSVQTMVSDIFLKHVRRLIYNQFYLNRENMYRRMYNPLFRLSYSNSKNRREPAFDEQGNEAKTIYELRKSLFLLEVNTTCKLTPEMQKIAERAYNTDTTLWFTTEQENNPQYNLRRDIIAAGQFTTCYELIRYSLSLKHSRYFSTLSQLYQDRLSQIIEQLKKFMIKFEESPYFLYNKLAKPATTLNLKNTH